MKKIFMLIAAAIFFAACSNQKPYEISGTITDFATPEKAEMLYLKTRTADDVLIVLDSVLVNETGTFIFKNKTAETDLFFLATENNSFFIRIFIDPNDKIVVTGSKLEIDKIAISGSKTQHLYNEYLSMLVPIQEAQKIIVNDFRALSQDESLKPEEMETKQKELGEIYDKLDGDIKMINKEFVETNNASIVAAYLVFRNVGSLSTTAEIEEQLNLLAPEMNNKFVNLIKKRIEIVKVTEVGSVLPNIELPDAEGKLISIASLRGKYVLVDFWASWCGPCIGEIPYMKEAYAKFYDKGFEILSISLDNDKAKWLEAVAKYELNWLHVSDLLAFESPIVKQFAVSYVPHTFLLDTNGVILAVDIRGDDVTKKLEELIDGIVRTEESTVNEETPIKK